MKIMKISAVICALTAATAMTISASAAKDLTPTDTAHKFDLGSDNVGGSGVEPDGSESGQNWIKVVQSSNPGLKLFDDVGPEVNVTALAVTFEISEWSGTEFSVSWGANIDFFDDASTTWCGTDAFSKISEYTITGDGEYTLVCDLEAMTSAQGKEGISHLQTCEMVIGNVATGDTTQIEVKSARIYVDGETPEETVIPSSNDESQSEENSSAEDDTSEDSLDTDNTSESSVSSSEADSKTDSSDAGTSNTSKSETSNGCTAAKNTSNIAATSTASDNTNADTGAAAGIALASVALASAAVVVSKRK